MRYLSVCSGIEAASVAWHPLGWTPVAFSEIEPFPAAVLKHRFPTVPNYGDMMKHKEWPLGPGSIDLLVGGTPCQSFSVAGLRKGLSDPRGGLMLTYLEIAQSLRPRWVVWENVPGVLSSGGGRDFGSFLGALGQLGYQYAYRVLDAQWVRTHGHPRAVPQRRRRVFVVGRLVERGAGDWTAAASVLFERESVCRDSAPRRAAREEAPADAGERAADGCHDTVGALCADTHPGAYSGQDAYTGRLIPTLQPAWPADVSPTLNQSARGSGAPGYSDQEIFAQGAGCLVPQPVPFRKAKRAQSATDDETWVEAQQANTLNGFDTGERDTHAVAFPIQDGREIDKAQNGLGVGGLEDPGYTVDTTGAQAVAFQQNQVGEVRMGVVAGTVNTNSNPSGRNTPMVAIGTDCYNGAVTGDVAATMGTPGSSVNASGPTVMTFPIDGRNALRDADKLDKMNRQGMGIGDSSDPSHTVTSACIHGVAHAFYSTGGTHGLQAQAEVSPAVKVGSGLGIPSPPAVAHALRGEGFDASEDGTGRGTPLVAASAVAQAMTVRRLTPRECERLQGFPDDWTLIPWRGKPADQCPDGPRYKALGNSMAVNCMAWIGQRIHAYEQTGSALLLPPHPTPGTGAAISTNGGE